MNIWTLFWNASQGLKLFYIHVFDNRIIPSIVIIDTANMGLSWFKFGIWYHLNLHSSHKWIPYLKEIRSDFADCTISTDVCINCKFWMRQKYFLSTRLTYFSDNHSPFMMIIYSYEHLTFIKSFLFTTITKCTKNCVEPSTWLTKTVQATMTKKTNNKKYQNLTRGFQCQGVPRMPR